MSLWIIDTDHVSLFLAGNRTIRDRILRISSNDVAITIVTVQEVFNGWMSEINAPSQSAHLVKLYTSLWLSLDFFKSVQVLNFDEDADCCLERLLQENPNLQKKRLQKDMRITAIALSLGATVVTRNHRDFSQVPGLLIEDWTQDI
jgi:tRNA(fMet)-specific endonuclease VapC